MYLPPVKPWPKDDVMTVNVRLLGPIFFVMLDLDVACNLFIVGKFILEEGCRCILVSFSCLLLPSLHSLPSLLLQQLPIAGSPVP